MQRRDWLILAGGVSVVACGAVPRSHEPARAAPAAANRIQGICFDLFTLFDPRSVARVAQHLVAQDAAALCETWRTRQFQYAFLRAAAGRYRDFRTVTLDALEYALAEHKLTLGSEDKQRLVNSYSELTPWPDTLQTLSAFKRAGLRLAPLANYAPGMLSSLLANAGLTDLFDAQISTDAAQTFKPDPRAYALGEAALGLDRSQIAFAAFGGWDAAGARWFGYPTFWVNRLGVSGEKLEPGPHASGPTLAELASFVASWRG